MRKMFLDNAIKIGAKHGKRFIGNFIQELPEICNDTVFVKYAKHKKGEERAEPKLEKDHVTLVVLIKGKYTIQFPDEKEEYFLEKEGDMVYFANKVNHTWKALTDCLLIVISWKKSEKENFQDRRKTFLDNAIKVGANHGMWFVGDHIQDIPELKNKNVFVKYGKHKKGDSRVVPKLNTDLTTITFLVYGKFKIQFPDEKKEYILEKEGDMVFYEKNVNHVWEVLEDCLTICVSFKKDI